MNRFLIFFLLPFCLGLTLLNGAEDDIKTRLRFLNWDSSVEPLYIKQGNKFLKLSSSTSFVSPAYSYIGPRQLALYDSSAPNPETKKRVPVALIQLNSNWAETLVLLSKAKNSSKARYGGIAYPYGNKNFPFGNIRFFNMSSFKVGIKVDEKNKTVKPTGYIDFKYEYSSDKRSIWLKAFLPKEDKWKQIYNSPVNVNPNSRLLVFMSSTGSSKNPNLRYRFLNDSKLLSDEVRVGFLERPEHKPELSDMVDLGEDGSESE